MFSLEFVENFQKNFHVEYLDKDPFEFLWMDFFKFC